MPFDELMTSADCIPAMNAGHSAVSDPTLNAACGVTGIRAVAVC